MAETTREDQEEPDDLRRLADSRYHLGAQSLQEGNLARAERLLRQAVRLEPRHAGAHNALGVIFRRRHSDDDAEKAFRAAIRSDPRQPEPCWRLGDLLRHKGRLTEAEALLREAIALDPGSGRARILMGRVFLLQNRTGLATESFARALEISPDDADLHIGLAWVHFARSRRTDAIRCLERALELDPASSEANYDLGVASRENGDLAKAMECFRRALESDPRHCAARTSLAMLSDDSALSEAAEWFGRCIREGDSDASLHHDRAYCLFMLGRLEEAWEDYEYRWQLPQSHSRDLDLPQARWDGSDVAGQVLFVWCEQGIGDEIMFASVLPEAMKTDARVLVECARRLIPLFERSFPGIEFLPHGRVSGDGSGAVHIDRQIPAGSLPRLFRRSPESFPGRPYLIADPATVEELRDKYVRAVDDMVVGISWRGGALKTLSDQRSIGLSHWSPILSIPNLRFLSLQYGRVRNSLERLSADSGLTLNHDDTVDPLKDMDRFAAQVAACDLVISVDNSTLHLAGALGRPVWAFIPFIPDWRWGRRGEESHWYPSARLFRQTRPGRWEEAIARVAADLHRMTNERKSARRPEETA